MPKSSAGIEMHVPLPERCYPRYVICRTSRKTEGCRVSLIPQGSREGVTEPETVLGIRFLKVHSNHMHFKRHKYLVTIRLDKSGSV